MSKVEFGKSNELNGLTYTIQYSCNDGNDKYEYIYEFKFLSGKATFAQIEVLQTGVAVILYSDSISKEDIRYEYKETSKYNDNIPYQSSRIVNAYYEELNFDLVNGQMSEDTNDYKLFSELLNNLEEKYDSIYNNFTPLYIPLRFSGGLLESLLKNQENYYNRQFSFSIINDSSVPLFYGYGCGVWFGVTDLDYVKANEIISYNYENNKYISMPVPTADLYNNYRHYALAHMLYDEKYRESPGGKQTFAENILTNIKYDGSKKASLIITHQFNLEEYQKFTEETEVYKIPGYFINLAVNIRTVDPISGDNVNVYNLHKIDLPRDGFTKSELVDDTGKSKSFTYTYGDLVKACDNAVLSLPMKISVDVIQFAEAVDGSPYVIYTNPIVSDIEINEIQHLYDSDTPAGAITNSIVWSGYDGSDDGDNSSGDGKNDDKGDKSGGTGSGQGTHNVLTTTYVSNATRLQALGDFLWSSSFLDNILLVNNNPIENVISVKMFPFTLPTGADSTIVLGNVDTEVPTNKLPDSYNYYHVYGSVKVPSYYNNFMDYAPYTRILLYLPFYGTLELDNSLIIDRSLKIAYIVDVVTGACSIDIYADDSLITVVSCQVGIDIPITSSNRAQVESAILTNTLTSVVSGAKVGGGVGAVVGGVGGALMSAGHCKYNTQTSGTPSSATELYNVSVPMLIIDRPKYREISGFAHNKGKMCMLTKKLSDVSGFSIFDENIDLSGVGCTETEQEILRNLLKTGIYL